MQCNKLNFLNLLLDLGFWKIYTNRSPQDKILGQFWGPI